ncbi:MAG: AMP-binding protein, partial [Acidobacteriaceae bacterium]|nr:AMP-binding protein [Acidobacteriaceae bacterium]
MSDFAWYPTPDVIERARLTEFLRLSSLRDYEELYRRSVDDVSWFTQQVLRFLNIRFDEPYTSILDLSRGVEWPEWCVNAKLNITESCLQHDASRTAVISESEDGDVRTLTYGELRREVARRVTGLRASGIEKGDRVGIYMPMVGETVVMLLALARIGAIAVPLFSGYGPAAIEQRLNQTAAKVLIACDSFVRAGKRMDLLRNVDEALKRCPSVERLIVASREANTSHGPEPARAVTAAEDPLLIIFSSGTTGEPKGIVHSHCSFPIKAAQDMALNMDIHEGDRISWITDLGWMMGPWLIYGCLILGATVVLYDGACDWPRPDRLWEFASKHRLDVLGVSPSLIRKLTGYGTPQTRGHDLTRLRFFASSGEPWDTASWWWLFNEVRTPAVPIINYSGGTEISGGILANHPLAPMKPCGFAAACPGIAADVVNESGQPVHAGVGELAIRKPWIGQARGFWNEPERYLASYWSRVPGLWIHGDWAERDADGHWFIHGRS